jgi:predicted neuraminidase
MGAMRPAVLFLAASALATEVEREAIFPPEALHNHSPSIAEFPNGELFAVWFRGSGERKADDVQVMGARKKMGAAKWSAPFVVADYVGFPDTNCVLFLDRDWRLWLFWMTFVATEVETTVINYRVSRDYEGLAGSPKWERQELLLLPIDPAPFSAKVRAFYGTDSRYTADAADKYKARMGWMVRTLPVQLPSGRIVLGLYSDLFDFSLAALSDDGGATWRSSEPIVGHGGVQPAFFHARDGRLIAYMRDNGPAPKRILRAESRDGGETWTPASDTGIPNPGSSVAALTLPDGRWLLIFNDTEKGRHSLAVSISTDEGRTWRWTRHLARGEEGTTSFHYPFAILSRDGTVQVVYTELTESGKTIRYASFPVNWVEAP